MVDISLFRACCLYFVLCVACSVFCGGLSDESVNDEDADDEDDDDIGRTAIEHPENTHRTRNEDPTNI